MFCSNCGSRLPEGARFCSTCGARVAEVFEVPEVEEKPAAFGFTAKAPDPETVKPVGEPVKKRVTFDWSNVIDEPQKKTIPDIKSPWATTGGVDEKKLYAEMGTSSEHSRTMSFIDVLRAEKEQQASAVAEEPAAEPAPAAPAAEEKRPFEYTEVLDPGYLEPAEPAAEKKEEEIPQLHFAPLYEDVDAPVVSPFDIPEEEEKAAPASEIHIKETVTVEEPVFEAPAADAAEEIEEKPEAEPAAEIQIEGTAPAEEPVFEAPAAEEAPAETEAEAPAEEPAVEAAAPVVEEEPAKPRRGWFDLPDFLKPKEEKRPFTAFTEEAPEPVPAAEVPAAEPVVEAALAEEVVFEEPEFDDTEAATADEVQIEAPVYEPEANLEDEIDSILKGGSGLMGYEPEETVEVEEETEDEIFEGDIYNNTENEYLDINTDRDAEPVKAEEAAEDDDADEPVDEQELFADMTENAPKHSGMTIAPPADKETEIEALKKRLAELMGTSWEPEAPAEAEAEAPAAEPVVEAAAPAVEEEPAEQDYYFKDAEPAEEPAVETVAYEEYDHADFTQYEAPVSTAAYEDEYLTEAPAAEPVAEEAPAEEPEEDPVNTYAHLILTPEEPVDAIPGAESKIVQAAPAEEPAVEEAAPAVEPVEAEEPEEVEVVEEPAPVVEKHAAKHAAEPAIEDFYLMDEEPVEEEIIFRANEPAAFEEEAAAIEEPEAPAEEEAIVFEAPEEKPAMIEIPAVEEAAEAAAEEPAVIEIPAAEEAAQAAVEEVAEAAAEPVAEEKPKTIDDFLADILREGAAPAAASAVAAPAAEEAAAAFKAPEVPAAEEPVVEAAPVAEEPAAEAPGLTLEDLVPEAEKIAAEAPAAPAAEIAGDAAEEAAADIAVPAPAADELTEGVVLTAEDLEIPTFKEAPAAAESNDAPVLTLEDLAPAAAATAVEAPAPEAAPAPEKKESDALSIEELEQDLFGTSFTPEAEVEATKKIDKFYTLYRKNEEFQRLLDEEYNKLKAAGGPVPEPALPDNEPKEVKHKKIEDATIYQDFDLEKEAAKLRAEQEKAAANAAEAKAVVDSAAKAVAPAAVAAGTAAAGTAAAVKIGKAAEKEEPQQLEYEEVEKGGGFLTVLAVIIAILLIILLGVILVLNFMPDSSLALRIDSIIENITSHFTAVDVMGKTLLL